MVRREEFLEAVSRVREVVGEGDCLDCRHGGGLGSRSRCCLFVLHVLLIPAGLYKVWCPALC